MLTPRRLPLILVVDDDLTTNRMIQGVLVRAGFRTACAYDVAGAVAAIREHRPDLLLLDVGLPDGSGYDVCRTLQTGSGAGSTPVLFISANDDVKAKVEGFQAGGVDYITKPLAGAEIIARVSTHLRLKHAYERIAELQTEQIQRLAGAQAALMPAAEDYPDAGFQTALDQVLKAGGDFYDVIPVGDQVYDYLVADASGHDLSTSVWTAALKALVAEYASPATSPREIVNAINDSLCRILPEGMFFTLIYARLNRRTSRLNLISAGHTPALVFQREKAEPSVIWQEGDVAGAFKDAVFAVTEVSVRTGDRFFLYSDGLIEVNGSRDTGIRHLCEACQQHLAEPLSKAVQSIRRTVMTGVEPEDDTLLLGVDV